MKTALEITDDIRCKSEKVYQEVMAHFNRFDSARAKARLAEALMEERSIAVLAERERCLSKVRRPDPSDWSIPTLDEPDELLEYICTQISGESER